MNAVMRARRLAAPALALLLASPGACRAREAAADAPSGGVGLSGAAGLAHLDDLLRAHDGSEVALVLPPLSPDRPHRVALARRCAAPPERIRDVLMQVERYPAIVPQVAAVDVRERGDRFVDFDVELELPLQNLRYGLRYDAREPGRIDVRGVRGALRGGRWSWEWSARDEGTTVIYTSESELGDDGGVLIEQVLRIHPDLEQGLAFAQGLRFLRAVCDAAAPAGAPGTPRP